MIRRPKTAPPAKRLKSLLWLWALMGLLYLGTAVLPVWAEPAEKKLDPGTQMSLLLMDGPFFKAKPEEYLGVGIQASIIGNYPYAVALLTKAITAGTLPPRLLSRAYLNRGMAYAKQGRHRQAIMDYTKSLEALPTHADTFLYLGNALRNLGDMTEAVISYDRAINLKPNFPEAYYQRGTVWLLKGDYNLAASNFSEAIRLRPKMADAFYQRSVCFEKLRRYSEAISDMRSFHLLNPLDESVPHILEQLIKDKARYQSGKTG
jgi:tetratricopeptide (TPR) repeat protein